MPRRSSSLTQVVDGAIDREINSKYDDVKKVADNIDDVTIVANATATTAVVAANIGVVTAVGSNIDAVIDVHNNSTNIVTIVDNFTNINTVADSIVDINDVASSIIDVSTVSANIADVSTVAGSITQINQVAADTIEIHDIVNTVVPNIAEILQADSNAVIATAQAALANTARVAAEVAQGIAEAKADEANLSMVAADISADLAAASASTASTKAGEASASAVAAHNSELAAAAVLDSFDDRYLGAFASNPTVDNDGNALTSGALYFNTTTHNLRVYDAGLVDWIALSGVTFAGLQDVNLTSVTTGDVLRWNGTDWVNTKAVGLNSLQLLGGTGTQGTMTWNADEETVDVVQNGAVLQLGQETQVHVRNNSGSSIADGKVVMATGTLGVSSRITAGLYDGASDVKYVLGVATETIADGDDGKVTSFGKIRGINTSAWNEGDVLYTTTAGGLTNVAPTTGVKLAVAMVITKHAINGTVMVRVNGVNELAYQPLDAALTALAGVTTAADKVIYATGIDTFGTSTLSAFGRTLIDDADATTARATLGVVIGTNVQAYDAGLLSIAGLTTAADKMIYTTASDVYATATLTAAGRALIDDADAAAQRTTLGINATNTPSTAVGGISATNVQAAIQELDSEKVDKSVVVTSAITSVTFNADGTITIVTP